MGCNLCWSVCIIVIESIIYVELRLPCSNTNSLKKGQKGFPFMLVGIGLLFDILSVNVCFNKKFVYIYWHNQPIKP